MNTEELMTDKLIEEWLDTLNPKPSTRAGYIHAMKHYVDFTGRSPEELLKEAEGEIRQGLLMRERSIKKDLVGFRKSLQDRKLAPMSVKSYLTGIRSFYRTFDIEIPNSISRGNNARTLEKHKKIPDKEDIRKVLKTCGVRNRAIVLVGCSSGLSANEIINLRVSDFKNGYDPETGITTLDLRRQKVGFDFVTFLTPEASQAILEYIDYRNRTLDDAPTERKLQLAKKHIRSDNDYLFIRENISDKYLKTDNDKLRKLDKKGFITLYRHLSETAGDNTPGGNWNLIRSHNMRKMFNTALLNAGCDSFTVEYLMGHSLDATRSAYFRASPEKLKEIYKKYVPYLTIQKPLDVSESKEYKEIKHENDILRAETATHIVERSDLANVKAELDALKQHQNDLAEMLSILKEQPEVLVNVLNKTK